MGECRGRCGALRFYSSFCLAAGRFDSRGLHRRSQPGGGARDSRRPGGPLDGGLCSAGSNCRGGKRGVEKKIFLCRRRRLERSVERRVPPLDPRGGTWGSKGVSVNGIGSETMSKGKVYLVGAGPGDAGLMTVRGMELLHRAEGIVYDQVVNPALLEVALPGAER